MIAGILTTILLFSFLALIIWAWSDRRKEDFEHLSNIPLDDDLDFIEKKGEDNGND